MRHILTEVWYQIGGCSSNTSTIQQCPTPTSVGSCRVFILAFSFLINATSYIKITTYKNNTYSVSQYSLVMLGGVIPLASRILDHGLSAKRGCPHVTGGGCAGNSDHTSCGTRRRALNLSSRSHFGYWSPRYTEVRAYLSIQAIPASAD